MDIISTFAGLFGFGDMGMGSVVMLLIGACVGWAVPQPAFVKPVVDLICDKFGLTKFHKEGHIHSDDHQPKEEKTDELPK